MKKNIIYFFIFLIFLTSFLLFISLCHYAQKKTDFIENAKLQEEQNNLQKYDVQIQSIGEFAFEMGVAIVTSTAASMANATVGSQSQLLMQTINKNSRTAQTTLQLLQDTVQKQQQQELKAMITAFSQAQQDAQSQTKDAQAIADLELDYLYKNISMEKPQQNYVFNQIQYDQLFSSGTMLTPQGPLWKNPFSVGDWEYEADENSFWQYQNSPLMYKKVDQNGNTTNSSTQAENNSIFAEYYNNSANYTIAGSMTIYAISYPFFVGIMFNKARWISGDFESVRKCRMAGIYGASQDAINFYFAQQYTMTDEQIKLSPDESPTQTPLQQIINNKVQPKQNIPFNSFASIATTPVVVNFSIENSPTAVTISFWIQNDQPKTFTIDTLDNQIYTYHGIGFICPGAIAQFKLTQPTDFIFTEQALSNYKD